MTANTKIEWADHTWSPWEGCTRVSTAATGGGGCDNCYAERMNRWLHAGANWGPGAPRREFGDDHWEKPLRWNAKAAQLGVRFKVFPSICDPFDNEVDEGLRMRFFRLILDTPHLTWLLLTKRIGNVLKMVDAGMWEHLTHVWLGATLVNRPEMLRDGQKLKAVNATVRFWSVEPMLGDLGVIPRELLPDWVICGGESGPKARPMHPDWARSLRDQCAAAGVAFHFKQWGEWAPGSAFGDVVKRHAIDRAGRVVEDWRGREAYPRDATSADGWSIVHRAGKKAAGRLLDGVEHNGFPA